MKYIVKRILQMIPSVLLVLLITFTLSRIVPGDPARMMAVSYTHLDGVREHAAGRHSQRAVGVRADSQPGPGGPETAPGGGPDGDLRVLYGGAGAGDAGGGDVRN